MRWNDDRWAGEAGSPNFNTRSLRGCQRKRNGRLLNERKEIKTSISGRAKRTIRSNTGITLGESWVSSKAHSFFHKNQWTSTRRPSHMGEWELAAAHRKPKHSQTSSFHPFLKKKILGNSIRKYDLLKTSPVCELTGGSFKEKILSSGKDLNCF